MSGPVTVTIESEDDDIPEPEFIAGVVEQACSSCGRNGAGVNVQVVDEPTMASLNLHYRGQDSPTNVLSFSSDLPDWIDCPLIGDIVLCPSVIRREACAYQKSTRSRWVHMLVHGSLHLLGMGHENNRERAEMEAMELKIMNRLGYQDPYLMAAE